MTTVSSASYLIHEAWVVSDKKAYMAAYYERNRERLLAEAKARQAAAPEKAKAASAAYYERNKALVNQKAVMRAQANPEKRKETERAYYERNRAECNKRTVLSRQKKLDHFAAKTAEWRAKNPGKVKQIRRTYVENNAAYVAASKRLRTTRTTVLQPWLTQAHVAEMDGLYQFCRIFPGYAVDHIIPLNGKRVSGLHVPENLQVLTVSENSRKGARYQVE